jgi:hypothetical protein
MFWETPTCSSAEIHQYKIQRRFSQQFCCGGKSSGVRCCVTGQVVPNIMQDHSASLLRSKWPKQNGYWLLLLDQMSLEHKNTTVIPNARNHMPDDRVLHPGGLKSSAALLSQPGVSHKIIFHVKSLDKSLAHCNRNFTWQNQMVQ